MNNLKERILGTLNNILFLCDIKVTTTEKLAAVGMDTLLGPYASPAESGDTRTELNKLIAEELGVERFRGSLIVELEKRHPGHGDHFISQAWFRFWATWAAKNLLTRMGDHEIKRLHPYLQSIYREFRNTPPLTAVEKDIIEAVNMVVFLDQQGLSRRIDMASQGLCAFLETIRTNSAGHEISDRITEILRKAFPSKLVTSREYLLYLLQREHPGKTTEEYADMWIDFWADWVIDDCLHRAPEDGKYEIIHPLIHSWAHKRDKK